MTENSSELTEFINVIREGIEKSQKVDGTFELLTPIEFEISVIVKKTGKGGINVAIVEAGGKYEKESVSKIKFSIGNTRSWEQLAKMFEVFQIQHKMSNEDMETCVKALKALQSQTKSLS